MLAVDSLVKKYDRLTAVDGLSFQVPPGQILGLVGPNGSGKTTTLRCIAGILPPTSGSVLVGGHSIASDPLRARANLAFIPDDPSLFEYLTVREHLDFFARLYNMEDGPARSDRLLRELDLEGKTRSLPQELSRGMKQKLAIACGVIHDPGVLLLDEPLTGLDPAAMRNMKDHFLALAAAGTCIVLSSHLLSLVQELAHRVLVIQDGTARAYGTLEEIVQAARLGTDADLETAFLEVTRRAPASVDPDDDP